MVSLRTPTSETYPKETKHAEKDGHFSMLDRETLKAIQLLDRRGKSPKKYSPNVSIQPLSEHEGNSELT